MPFEELARNSEILALDEVCAKRGDEYGRQLHQRVQRTHRQLDTLREKVGAGEPVDQTEYLKVWDAAHAAGELVILSGRSPFELTR